MMTNPNNEIAVRNLQRYLRRLSLEENDLLPIPIDGIFDTATEEALMEFQRMSSLPVTGRADRRTWDLLFAEYLRLGEGEDRVDAIDFFPSAPPNYTTSLGEESSFILLLQWLLGELFLFYDTIPEPPKNGRFDAATSDAVREFQRIQKLQETGVVDRRTWNRLARAYSLLPQGE